MNRAIPSIMRCLVIFALLLAQAVCAQHVDDARADMPTVHTHLPTTSVPLANMVPRATQRHR